MLDQPKRSLYRSVLSGSQRAVVLVTVAGLLLGVASCGSDVAEATLPVRAGPRTETTHMVPHVQISDTVVPDVDAELRRRIYSLPGVENRETIVSVTGTTALWLNNDFAFADPEATMRDREFAHIHPDGSLHAVLPVDRALEATSAKWAELHPLVSRSDFWDGMVMLYTPQNFDELEVTWQLIVDSYNFVTDQNVDAADFATP